MKSKLSNFLRSRFPLYVFLLLFKFRSIISQPYKEYGKVGGGKFFQDNKKHLWQDLEDC